MKVLRTNSAQSSVIDTEDWALFVRRTFIFMSNRSLSRGWALLSHQTKVEMEPPKRLDLGYSLKNIPIPSPTIYTTRLIEKVENLIKRMRWKAFFFLKNDQIDEEQDCKEKFGFRTRKCPPRIEELEAFEDDLLKMIEDLRFRNTSNALQKQLRQDIEKIKGSKDVIVPADKTRNLYAVNKTQYEKLLRENITKAYKLAPACTHDDINKEAKGIAQRLEILERMNCMARNEAFITLKDHKEIFSNALPCRLINPAKSEIGRISKTTLDRILTAVNQKLQMNTVNPEYFVCMLFSYISYAPPSVRK